MSLLNSSVALNASLKSVGLLGSTLKRRKLVFYIPVIHFKQFQDVINQNGFRIGNTMMGNGCL